MAILPVSLIPLMTSAAVVIAPKPEPIGVYTVNMAVSNPGTAGVRDNIAGAAYRA